MAEKRKVSSPEKEAVAADKQKAQSERFIRAAREIGVDESGKAFEKAVRTIVSKPDKSKMDRGRS